MNQNPDIHRTASGAVDGDFYREDAKRRRTEWLRTPGSGGGPARLVALGAVFAALLALRAADGLPPAGADQAGTVAPLAQVN